MKKFSKLLLSAVIMVALVACSSTDKPKLKEDHTLYLITDVGTIDDKSFNQGSWEGVLKYVKENKKTHTYLQPSRQDDDEYYNTIARAINEGGAKVIVTPGYLFQNAVFRAQKDFPDVHFIFVDALPQENQDSEPLVGENTVSLLYEEQQAGFLAGYASVKEGMRDLGFIGGIRVPAVEKFGYGFVQGAEYAAQELNVDVKIRYNYAGVFEPSTEVNQMAASWYQSGVEVIFHAAGGAGQSVFSAAEQAGKKSIGVDTDQKDSSETVMTSAIKQLEESVYRALKAHYDGNFPGGQTLTGSVEDGLVGLPKDFSRFETFTEADYDAIFTKLKDNTDNVRTNIKQYHDDEFKEAGLQKVTITVIK